MASDQTTAGEATPMKEAVFVMDYCRTELSKAKESLSAARRYVRRCENELKIAHQRLTEAVLAQGVTNDAKS